MKRSFFVLALAVAICGCGPSEEDQAKAWAPATPAERQIVERAFCAALGGDPNRDVLGIDPVVSAQVEHDGVEHVRAGFIIQQWFNDLADHKIPTACGKPVAGYQSAAAT